MRLMLTSVCLIAAFVSASVVSAQTAAGAAPHAGLAAHPISQLVGEWRGQGWMAHQDGSRTEYETIERVRWNLAGTALIVEGMGRSTEPDTGEFVIGHDAFALVTWDQATNAPVFNAKRANEPFAPHALEVNEETGVMTWEFMPNRVRFNITIKDDVWTEFGEYSPDGGGTWVKFLETKLQRQH